MLIMLCTLKMYIISVLQGRVTIFSHTFGINDYELRIAFIFGYFIVGNFVDNISTPKVIAIVLQCVLGVLWIFTGVFIWRAMDYDCKTYMSKTSVGVGA